MVEEDRALIRYLQSQRYYWEHSHDLDKVSVSLLARCPNVIETTGQPISLVAESPMLVIDETEGMLRLTRYPKTRYHSHQTVVKRTDGVYSYLAIPDSLARFFQLADSAPQVPAHYNLSLQNALGEQVDWYDMTEQTGTITLGEWDDRVHVWLHLKGTQLEVRLLCQSQDGASSMPAGTGEAWYQGNAKVWFRRDPSQEQQKAQTLADSLGLQGDIDTPFLLESPQIADFLTQLSGLKEVPLHWHASSKKVQQVRTEDLSVAIGAEDKWFSVSGSVSIDGGLVLDLQRLLSARQNGFVTVESDDAVLMIDAALRRQLSLLDSMLDNESRVEGNLAYPLRQLLNQLTVSSDQSWQALEQQWQHPVEVDEASLSVLREYQHSGVLWAIHLLSNGFGACLADDMGLGKTLQALKVIEHFSPQGPSLVVCPKSVLLNWQQECARFTPTLNMIDLENCPDRSLAIEQAKAGEVVLISYGLVTRMSSALQAQTWQSAVLDEAQHIKNPTAQRAKALTALTAERRLTLSGTPVENHLVELWSQFAFLNPGLLGSLKQFKSKYGQAAKNEEDLLRLKAIVGPFVMRRMKTAVLTELPEKTELIHHIELSNKERSAYEAVRRESLSKAERGEGGTMQLLAALTRLRQVCCDPYLVFDNLDEVSSKLKAALELVQEAREGGHRILVFSQFVQLLKRFSDLVTSHQIGFSYLDGQSSTKARQAAIQAFKTGEHDLFLISLKAGGTGLNLTEADTVIHLDPWWNPAVEDQASDRAHRMGQTNPVTVYRLVASDTVEEKIIALHQEKRDLADKVLSGQSNAQQLSPALLLTLLDDNV
ncbi:DEAD/DEAH box helicase [Vibrio salilacus]|uniref:DEAD/DEAH box helicase n=1 Tax=Vibrio salilacus TaxID=1323749 RepID=UPI000C2A1226|nr:DEAD/DEAH box helicase [Vibrio salilacus]